MIRAPTSAYSAPSEGGPARRLRNPLSADEDTNACTNSLSMRQSDFNRNPSRTQPGKRSSVSSTGRRLWPGSRKTGLTLWQESRATADISAEESCFHKDAGDPTGNLGRPAISSVARNRGAPEIAGWIADVLLEAAG